MKLLLIFLVSVFFALVQEIGARPYPDDSSSSSSWYDLVALGSKQIAGALLHNPDISQESTDLLKQGSTLANQVLDLVGFVPGLESVPQYGKMGIKIAKNLRTAAVQTVTRFQEQKNDINTLARMGTNELSNVQNSEIGIGSYFRMIANGTEAIRKAIENALTQIRQMFDGIRKFISGR